MQEIVELERRIAAALERIGKGLDGLSAPAAMPDPAPGPEPAPVVESVAAPPDSAAFDSAMAEAAAEIAALLAALAPLPGTAFGPGTDKGETRAAPEIWTESDKFKAGMTKMTEELNKLNAAAKTGDLAQIKAAFGGAAQTCKSCHDSYRKD